VALGEIDIDEFADRIATGAKVILLLARIPR